ncbi:Hypothetical predicted protein [Lecanosticta acicola]|uniref:Uncharacterized protein n=1 Tax=Lecanosticta acicola TaxID=111012 RepID=A0AAI9ED04_9PEZI|nr:Hypothetical predicted protein [Lecanosticta acicola]
MKHRKAEAAKLAWPVIHKRLQDIQNIPPDSKPPSSRRLLSTIVTPPNALRWVDTLQWTLEDCNELAKKDPSELNEDHIVRRLLLLNLGTIYTTSTVTTNIAQLPTQDGYVEGLREEVGSEKGYAGE